MNKSTLLTFAIVGSFVASVKFFPNVIAFILISLPPLILLLMLNIGVSYWLKEKSWLDLVYDFVKRF